ncbi:MAG: hypothetical protein ACE5E5_00300 [Phycisphaerae bacterium]
MNRSHADNLIELRRAYPAGDSAGKLMRRASRWIMLICLTATATACTPAIPDACAQSRAAEQSLREAFNQIVAEQQLSQEDIQTLVLSEIPVELLIVLEDETRFTTTQDHPLHDELPGTLADADAAAFLNGCWGRIAAESRFGDPAHGVEPIDLRVAEAWRVEAFDSNGDLLAPEFQTITVHSLEGLGGMPCTTDNRPVLQSATNSVTQLSETEIHMTVNNAQAAGINDDGSLSLHEVGTAQASVTIGNPVGFFYTVSGDFLVTSGPDYDPDQPSVDDLEFWVRFTCPR